MLSRDFDFHLPESLIALRPSDKRDMSRLFVLHKNGGHEHRLFSDLPDYMNEGDVLLLNNTKVMPVRISAATDRGTAIEVLFVSETSRSGVWEVLCKSNIKGRIMLAGAVEAEIWTEKLSQDSPQRVKLVRLSDSSLDVMDVLERHGGMPLPPYIRRMPDHNDRERYQTVYAEHQGSIAAPTAGLHFTGELLNKIKDKGVKISTLTLHVGQGTFKPLRAERVEDHRMDAEVFKIPDAAVQEIRRAKESGRRVFSVGTTTTRAIESLMSSNYDPIKQDDDSVSGSTSIFIYPGYSFCAVDCLITNFHLPMSTPLMLASAFCGYDRLMKAYSEAIERGYRFFSYGDAMLIV
ncbi:MAG: tRNA preQ1(34) S-adenosylmethionine ribosyltransferase-isomerase QueA [Nitrospiraceae bacterium]|nr:tRNA preQ1(34) S-adenosylmethionine ribosyltransferase-isomerase QueA [Nitrospiraceae bacterium]